jgi:threonyl-tRNA synthetase
MGQTGVSEQRISVEVAGSGSQELAAGATVTDLVAALRLPRKGPQGPVVAAVDGHLVDLSTPLVDGASVALLPAASPEGREVLRHSTAHVLAQAVVSLWPGAKFAIGPVIEDGFYYDFELPGGTRFTDEDLGRIEARMREIVSEDQPFVREEHTLDEGLSLFAEQPFKTEIIQGVGEHGSEEGVTGGEASVVSAYRNTEEFVDLCRGPHVPSTSRLGSFKLLRVAGAYWRGDEHRQQLQRIYGTAWESKEALAGHLERLAEAERRDHRRLGAELDLFHFPPEIGPGLAVFHPKGAIVRTLMEDFARQIHFTSGYQPVWTPHTTKSTLFEISGHLGWYAEGMYPPMEMEGVEYRLKPMNCPMHILIYKDRQRSYRELPMRLFELGTVYRFERSGVLHGLARVRGLTQDDSHIFCAPDQLQEELASLLAFVLDVLRTFGLTEFDAELSTRPEKFVGEVEEWDIATEALRKAIEASGIPYVLAEGEGAFYAPKIDVHLKDAIGRRWQVSTLQVDFQLPQRFGLEFVGPDNERHRPYMIHRALFGSVERFFAILLEHYAGALPTWLSPTQVTLLPVRDEHGAYAKDVAQRFVQAGLRATVDHATEPLGGRVRRAKMEKVPYVLVVGDDDVASGTVGVNRRGSPQPHRGIAVDDVISGIVAEVAQHATEPRVPEL